MATMANLKVGESLSDRVMKVDHAGEHGAICIYSAQIWFARWRAPQLVNELTHFRDHELGHRALFLAQLQARGVRRCRSYYLCAAGGLILGSITGILGKGAIAATTVSIESVVLKHLRAQILALEGYDDAAVRTLKLIIDEEQEHHDQSSSHLSINSLWSRTIGPVVSASTEVVIWLGMHL